MLTSRGWIVPDPCYCLVYSIAFDAIYWLTEVSYNIIFEGFLIFFVGVVICSRYAAAFVNCLRVRWLSEMNLQALNMVKLILSSLISLFLVIPVLLSQSGALSLCSMPLVGLDSSEMSVCFQVHLDLDITCKIPAVNYVLWWKSSLSASSCVMSNCELFLPAQLLHGFQFIDLIIPLVKHLLSKLESPTGFSFAHCYTFSP